MYFLFSDGEGASLASSFSSSELLLAALEFDEFDELPLWLLLLLRLLLLLWLLLLLLLCLSSKTSFLPPPSSSSLPEWLPLCALRAGLLLSGGLHYVAINNQSTLVQIISLPALLSDWLE